MNITKFMIALLVAALSACGHDHAEDSPAHEEPKFKYTGYNPEYELFAEADPFIVNDTANILSHFTLLKDFTPVESCTIKTTLSVEGQEIMQILEKPSRKGIYSFNLKPEKPGKGILKFEISDGDRTSVIEFPDIMIYEDHGEAHEAAEAEENPQPNTTVFTKEQSWKIDFETGHPVKGAFGQVIKTTALVKPSPESEMLITAKTNGTVRYTNNNILEGHGVSANQTLFTISGSELAENNFSVRYSEAENNFLKAEADYSRARELSKDKIVSEKELLNAKIQHDNAKAIFDNLKSNFSNSGQRVISPVSGFIRRVYVSNGSYVEAGQPVLAVSQDKSLMLTAEVNQRYAHLLSSIKTADIRTIHDNRTYTLEELGGRILSFGRSAGTGSFLIPVNLQVENKGIFIPGTFVEVFLKTITSMEALTVPNTALIEEQSNFFIYVQVTPELFEKREVSTGNSDGRTTEILSGINEKERIVTKGAIFIKLAQSTGTLDAHSGHVH